LLSLLRMTRSLRLVRVLRVIRNLRPLTILIGTILATLLQVFWALFLLSIIIYTFSVAFTLGAAEYLYGQAECTDPNCEVVLWFFGTLPTSFSTLFQSITGGIDWGNAADALHLMGNSGWVYYMAFNIYIAITFFSVINVIAALFCQQVVQHALTVDFFENQMECLEKVKRDLLRLFHELDEIALDSPPGMVTYPELEDFLEDFSVQREFALIGIDPQNAWMLFMLLDEDNSGLIDIDEFVAGCLRLRGECQRLDLHMMLHEFSLKMEGLNTAFMNMSADQKKSKSSACEGSADPVARAGSAMTYTTQQ